LFCRPETPLAADGLATIRSVSSPFSVDDAFTVGVSFDLLGGYLLGRGLLASPAEIAQRGKTYVGWNSADVIGQIRAGADGRIGLGSLAIGFLLQAGGYVALIAGATLKTGGVRAVAAVVLALGDAFAWWLLLRRVHAWFVKRLAVDVARVNGESGELGEYPDGRKLLALGQALGFLPTEVMGSGNPGALDRYAKRYFGVDRVEHGVPPSTGAHH
jgi:hypothetical protein